MSDIRLYEDWRTCPIIYNGRRPPGVVIGEIVPKPLPTLDTHALFALGYRETSKNELIRVGMTKARRPQHLVEMWYIDAKQSPRHVAGFGATYSAAYSDAWRLRRQVDRFGSRIAASEFARERIKAQSADYDDEITMRQFELALAG